MKIATRDALILVLLISPSSYAFDKPNPWGANLFAEKYKAMSLAELERETGHAVPTKRLLVAAALAQHGTEAWPMLQRALRHRDWKVRSTAVMTIDRIFGPPAEEKDAATKQRMMDALLQQYPGVVEALRKALTDDYFWVRCQAAASILKFGAAARPAVGELVELCGDPHPWTRAAAAETLFALPGIPQDDLVEAAVNVLMCKRTNFADSFRALRMLKFSKNLKKSERLQRALIHFLDNPGQGMWSNILSWALQLLAAQEPDFKDVSPLYAKILTDEAYLLRGDVRKTLCGILAKMGPKAAELLPALRKMLAEHRAMLKEGKLIEAEETTAPIERIEETIRALEAR